MVPRKAYVEDALDCDPGNEVAIVEIAPRAPSPPSAVPAQHAQPVNVFDFLVTEETPNASRVSLGGSKEQMQMVEHAPPIFEAGRNQSNGTEGPHISDLSDPAFQQNGYSYGTEPVPIIEYRTPKHQPNGSRDSIYELDGKDRKSTDKKRKRQQIEELDLTQARRSSQELDEEMLDAPPILHSGLTGGLNRLLSKSKFPPSPDYSGGDGTELAILSPVKKSRQIKEKQRGRTSSALIKVRKISGSRRRASDESRPRKHHRSHRHAGIEDDRPKRKMKAIEYPVPMQEDSPQQQLVVYRTRAELFMSFVTKGPESGSGCSINKALKRYHRERGDQGLGLGKVEEEKELWKAMRLKKNERGEVVLFF